jgi:GTPase
MLLVFNKIDRVPKMPSEEEMQYMTEIEVEERNYLDFEKLSEAYEKNTGIAPVFMAAHDGTHIDQFRASITREVKKQHLKIYPHYLESETIDLSHFDEK